MKKLAFCLSITLLTVMLIGCTIRATYRYLHEISQLTEIQIVEITDYIPGDEGFDVPAFEIICTIENTDALIDDLSDIECHSYFTDPAGVGIGSVGFKILYDNGDYELICASEQARYYAGQRFQNYAGFYYFDYEQFHSLIDKYTELYAD